MDGVIIESEQLWNRSRKELVEETGGSWKFDAHPAMMGMASHEWTAYMRDELAVPLPAGEISDRVVAKLSAGYRESPPLIPGAAHVVARAAERWPVAIASSSNRELIDLVAELAGISGLLSATVSSEEAGRGKPAPDVFLMAARELGARPRDCVVVEDSANGIRAALAAEMSVIAVPSRDFPPPDDTLAEAALVVGDIGEVTPDAIEQAGPR